MILKWVQNYSNLLPKTVLISKSLYRPQSVFFRFYLRELREFSQHFGQTLVYIRFDNLNVQQLTDLLRPMKSLKYIHYYNSYFTIEATNKLLENLSQNLFNVEGIDLQTFYFEIIHSLEDNNCRKF